MSREERFRFPLLRNGEGGALSPCRVEHILNEDPVPSGGIVHQNVGDCAHQASVLDDGRAGHECVNIGPTNFYTSEVNKYLECLSNF